MTCPAFLRRGFAALLSASLLLGGPSAYSNEANEKVALNFVNVDIEAVIRAIGKITGKNFLIDPRVKGTLNVTTQQPVPKEMTYQILLSALRLQGYTAVESKNLIKILPEADAKLHAVPSGRKAVTQGDGIVTQVFQIKHESALQLIPVIRPLVAPNNTVTAYAGNNTIVITDYSENVARIAQLIAAIDVPQGDVRIMPIQHGSAIDIAATINKLMSDGGAGAAGDASQRVTVMADSRGNNLLVRSENPSKLATIRQLVTNLDQPGSAGNVRVIYLRNAEATKVAQTLRGVLSGESASAPVQTGAPSNAGAATGGGGAPAASVAASGGGGPTTGSGIIADPTNNALIITAPEPVYNNLRKVIDQLDRRRAQVYVEALIAEMSAENAAEFGVQWFAGEKPSSDGSRFIGGGTNYNTSNPSLLGAATGDQSLLGAGLNVLVGAGTVNIPGVGDILNLQILARFLETQNKANILSTPTLLTLDNEEAKIVVAENLPFLTGQYSNTGGGTTPSNPFQTIERKDVGLTLKIKPQISEGGSIHMVISQENSNVVGSTSAGPTTRKRTIDTSVIVDDGAIVALGGLIQDQANDSAEKVPFLGNLPVVGSLFRFDTSSRRKTNLVVFLRPKIVRTEEDARGFTHERYDDILQLQKQPGTTRNYLMPDYGDPSLPPLERPAKKPPAAAQGSLPAKPDESGSKQP